MKKANEQTTKQKAAKEFIEKLENQINDTFEIQKEMQKIEFFAQKNDIYISVDDIIKFIESLRNEYQFIIQHIEVQTNESEN